MYDAVALSDLEKLYRKASNYLIQLCYLNQLCFQGKIVKDEEYGDETRFDESG